MINFGIIMLFSNPALTVRYGAVMQVLEFFILSGVLFIFRAQPLPPFYSIGLNEINNLGGVINNA